MKDRTHLDTHAATVADWVSQRTGESIPASLYAETLSTAEAIITAARDVD